MQLFLNTTNNKTLIININYFDKIKDIKQIIKDKEGIPIEKQYLIFSGITLQDENLLSDYNICNNLVRLKGGK